MVHTFDVTDPQRQAALKRVKVGDSLTAIGTEAWLARSNQLAHILRHRGGTRRMLRPRGHGGRVRAAWQETVPIIYRGRIAARAAARARGGEQPRASSRSKATATVVCYVAGRRWRDTLIKRSFSVADRRTSVALEQEFWVALMHIAASRRQTLTALVATADAQCPEGRSLASALRVLALQEFFRSRRVPSALSEP
jgi:predicted DNA-binding ribbon-helix-helix protein